MKISPCIACSRFPCRDVNHLAYLLPGIEVKPERVRLVVISEAAPPKPEDYYYAAGSPSFALTTIQAFIDAGAGVRSMRELLERGVYFTTAVKCGKKAHGIQSATIKECSLLLEAEIACFPRVKAFLLMGDVAIKAMNHISTRAGEGRCIPAGATYKIRRGKYHFRGARAYPSYLQVGPSFNIEKSKRRMIAEDLASALRLLN